MEEIQIHATFLFKRSTIFNVTNQSQCVCIQRIVVLVVLNVGCLTQYKISAVFLDWRGRKTGSGLPTSHVPLLFSHNISRLSSSQRTGRQREQSSWHSEALSETSGHQLTVTMWASVLALQLVLTTVNCFNLDTENPVVYQGDPGSLFGFSVAAHRDQQTGWWVTDWNIPLLYMYM